MRVKTSGKTLAKISQSTVHHKLGFRRSLNANRKAKKKVDVVSYCFQLDCQVGCLQSLDWTSRLDWQTRVVEWHFFATSFVPNQSVTKPGIRNCSGGIMLSADLLKFVMLAREKGACLVFTLCTYMQNRVLGSRSVDSIFNLYLNLCWKPLKCFSH